MYLGKVTEIAPAEELFTVPRHPYTGALLSAVPVPNPDLSDQRQQIILAGDVPSPIAPPSGCRFHPRCPKAVPVCVAEDPPLEPRLGDGPEHPAACHLPMAEGENLADFRPSISEQERVVEVEGSLLPDGAEPEDIGRRATRARGRRHAMSMPELRSAGTSEVLDETGEAPVSTKIEGRSPWRLAYERLRKDRAAKIALGDDPGHRAAGHPGPGIREDRRSRAQPAVHRYRRERQRRSRAAERHVLAGHGQQRTRPVHQDPLRRPDLPRSSACSPPGSASSSACCSA